MEGSVKGLLDAEKECQAIIEQANKDKTKKLNEAKVYAEQEINKFRKEYEIKYEEEANKKKLENSLLSQYDEEAKKDIQKIQEDFTTNKRQVIRTVLEQILNVNLEVPLVVKRQYE